MKPNLDNLFTEAYTKQRENNLEEAITLYKKILDCDPHHEQALHFLGLTYAQHKNFDSAIYYLHRALELKNDDATLHNNLGNVYKKQTQFNKAIEHYQHALKLSPHYAQAHHNLATVYALENHYSKALHHYHLALQAAPDFSQAHFNLGLLFLQNKELEAAKIQFNNVLTLCQDYWEAYFYLGLLNLEKNLLEEAAQAFLTVLRYDNEHVESLTNLGVIALKQEKGQVAINYFTQALAINSNHLEARNNLASTFIHYDRFENALTHYTILLEHEPENIEYLYNAGVAQMILGHLNEAILHFNNVLEQAPQHFAALNNLAAIYIRLEEKEKAKQLLREALAIAPGDPVSQHMLHALSQDELEPPTCPEYAINLFNNYALYYDTHLQDTLCYTLPQQLGRVLHQLNITYRDKVLDLGCGTGLCGNMLREITTSLTGVDISSKMLDRAREKNIYDELVESEALCFLKKKPQLYSLILAADILPYFGKLDSLFEEVKKHLFLEGYFIFTIEMSNDSSWTLQPSARFSHHPNYIRRLAAEYRLQLLIEEKVIARQQHNAPWPEIIFAFKNIN